MDLYVWSKIMGAVDMFFEIIKNMSTAPMSFHRVVNNYLHLTH